MANIQHIDPSARIAGFRAQVATLTPGLAVIRGTASDQANVAGALATLLLGVVDLDVQSPAIGIAAAIRLWQPGEIAYVVSGAAIAVDALLTTNASAQFVTCASTNKVLARALAPAAAAGELIPVIFQDGDRAAP
jgi:hypothetical protein